MNSKNLEHYAWVVALTRMISAVFRRGGEVAFVAEGLKQVSDPRGGQWSNARYVGSLVAAIGDVIERHMIETGFPAPAEALVAKAVVQAPAGASAAQFGPHLPQVQPARPGAGSRVSELRPLRLVKVQLTQSAPAPSAPGRAPGTMVGAVVQPSTRDAAQPRCPRRLLHVLGKKPTGDYWNGGLALLRNNRLVEVSGKRLRASELFR